ncbi:MAG: glyoxylate/hydroxypyruvate reductase A [Hyphomicrobiales bacterium]|nr:glyoxylate/hydroxypyruvate reductase A [Hyphomicrobiales bacterium]
MTLLIDVVNIKWMANEEVRDAVRPFLPDVEIRCAPDIGDPADIVMVAVSRLAPGRAASLPNLRLVQKLGAGVDSIVGVPDLPPGVRVARLRPDTPAREIAEYCLAHVLQRHRHLPFHAANQARGEWRGRAPDKAPATTVGVLGLGHIGGRVARTFAGLGFRVMGWSRTAKAIDGVDCRHGGAALPQVLAACDYVVAVLPSTPATQDLFDAAMLAHMKPGAVLVNVGRGDLIVDDDLLAALDGDRLGGAVLDVFRTEPLPDGHPFWSHPKVTVTPHVSGWHLDGGFEDVAENYRRLLDGRPLLHEVDRAAGY